MYTIGYKTDFGFNQINSIFKDLEKAQSWYENLPEVIEKEDLAVHKVPATKYPLYILAKEIDGRLQYYFFTNDISEIEVELKNFPEAKGEIHANLYVIKEDAVNSFNAMESCITGKTNYSHIDDEFLSQMKKEGIKKMLILRNFGHKA